MPATGTVLWFRHNPQVMGLGPHQGGGASDHHAFTAGTPHCLAFPGGHFLTLSLSKSPFMAASYSDTVVWCPKTA
jgi:hypothetical protein